MKFENTSGIYGWYGGSSKKKILNNETVTNHMQCLENRIQNYLNRINNRGLSGNHDFFNAIANAYIDLGLGHTYLNSEKRLITENYKTAVEYKIKHQKFKFFNFNDSIACFIYSICSRDIKLLNGFLQDLLKNPPKSKGSSELMPLEYNALFYLINNNEYNKANEKIEQFIIVEKKYINKIQGGVVGVGSTMRSILNNDTNGFFSGINHILEKFKRTYKKYGRLPISWDATYLIFLARDKKMNITAELLREQFPENYHLFFNQALLMD